MKMSLRVHQVMSLGEGMVRLILVRRSLKARIQPLPRSEDQRIAEDIASKLQQAFEAVFPGGIVVGGPMPLGGQWDAKVDMMITEDEYRELGKPGINDILEIDMKVKGSTGGDLSE
jgi:hypothetical protein